MRIAFVLARFGSSVIGGAEKLAWGLAAQASAHGWDVEVWTTCALDSAVWVNELPPGVSLEAGVTTRRFLVDEWDASDHHYLNKRLEQNNGVDASLQYRWVAAGPHSSALNQHILRNSDKFDAIVTLPYLHTIPNDAAWLGGDRVILLPCLHNELTAYMEPFHVLLQSVYGVVFISPEEASLAVDELGLHIERTAVIGSGVEMDVPSAADSPGETPYLLYVGRLEHGKNVPLLYDFVRRYAQEGGEIKLVVAGNGPCPPPDLPQIEYRGPVSEEEKNRLYAGALAVCQPSRNESFSLVIMESWLAQTPALVWSGCDVTRAHVQRSKGGLWFGSYDEFKEAVAWLMTHEQAARRMGKNGSEYVKRNFTWEHVFRQFADTFTKWGVEEAHQDHGQ